MSNKLKYQVVTDGEIECLFENLNFGEKINNSVDLKRLHLFTKINQKFRGKYIGFTSFAILAYAGLVHDKKESGLTGRGVDFMNQEINKGDKE